MARPGDLAGRFDLGSGLSVNRLGFGALRVTGPSFWGEPEDREAALALLRRLPDLGVQLADTADSYGPHVSENLIREALWPYPAGLVIATKGGYSRPRPGEWIELGRPEHLMEAARMSARRLGVETIALWQLHRIDPKVPRDEQFDAIRTLMAEGVIARAGLSGVSVEEIEAAQAWFPVSTVQNRYNFADRGSEPVLAYCESHGIGFMPFFPLGAGRRLPREDALSEVAARLGATPAQVALAWLLAKSPVVMPIPGTGSIAHLDENMAAAAIRLESEDLERLGQADATA